MAIDKTIPGGAYQNPDGTWVNAQGKPIKPPREEDLPKIEPEERIDFEVRAQTIDKRSADIVTPGASLTREYSTPTDLVDDEEGETVKRKVGSKKKS